jgi:mRNA-degrading endonuclease toxin of MazEF toxin-antitoxin module
VSGEPRTERPETGREPVDSAGAPRPEAPPRPSLDAATRRQLAVTSHHHLLTSPNQWKFSTWSASCSGAAPLVVVCPLTHTRLGYETHVEIEAKSAGIQETSYVQVEQIRTVSSARLVRPLGQVDILATMKIERILRYLLAL